MDKIFIQNINRIISDNKIDGKYVITKNKNIFTLIRQSDNRKISIDIELFKSSDDLINFINTNVVNYFCIQDDAINTESIISDVVNKIKNDTNYLDEIKSIISKIEKDETTKQIIFGTASTTTQILTVIGLLIKNAPSIITDLNTTIKFVVDNAPKLISDINLLVKILGPLFSNLQ